MASADLRDELLCSICLTTYTDPVMLRCGHNFCRLCIGRVLDTQAGAGVYSCPDCREEFEERPEIWRNLALRNIMENLLSTQPTQMETGIFCTYCVDSPVPAAKSCLRCEASLCDKHLSVHSKSAAHVLSAPSASLEDRKCSAFKRILEYYCTECDILLDVNTAGNYILISDDLKTATKTQEVQNHPETAERFQYFQVISRKSFTSGWHYWDVEIRRSGRWIVGMCYPSIDRRGDQSLIGHNNKSWCLGRCNNQYGVIHDSKVIWLPDKISSDRFRICLDYEAGRLSFYELCHPIRHLHTFTTTFTEPLHATLFVREGSIKISGRSSNWEKPS